MYCRIISRDNIGRVIATDLTTEAVELGTMVRGRFVPKRGTGKRGNLFYMTPRRRAGRARRKPGRVIEFRRA
jgi:hypothetical protein